MNQGKRHEGFTLLELILALALLGMLMALVAGSLGLAAKSWDAGEDRADRVGQLRITQTFLRSQLTQLLPLRWTKAQGTPLVFSGERDRLRFAAPLVARVGQGGVSWFQLSLETEGDKRRLVLRHKIPEPSLMAFPDFGEADKTVLAEDLAEIRWRYFGRGSKQHTSEEPTWRDSWDDPSRLPMLIELKVKPIQGAPWPELLAAPMVGGEAGCRWDSFHRRCV